MYISQFWVGVLVTINVELILIIFNAIINSCKNKIVKKDNENEKK